MRLSQALINLKNIKNTNPKTLQFKQQLSLLKYFVQAKKIASNRQYQHLINNFTQIIHITQRKKGQILYSSFDKADKGYILLQGSVKLFSSKSDIQIIEELKSNKKINNEQKINKLCKLINIEQQYVTHKTMEIFEHEKSNIFVYKNFHQIKQGQYFGFTEMLKMGMRPFLSYCFQDCIFIQISKNSFQKYLKQYEWLKLNNIVNILSSHIQIIHLELLTKMLIYLAPFIIIKNCHYQQILYYQDSEVTDLYMIVSGQFKLFKRVDVELPKNLKNQLQQIQLKRLDCTISIATGGQLMGEQDIVINGKKRLFGLKSVSQNGEILKIESNYFLKLLNQRFQILKIISKKAKEKLKINIDKYKQQQRKIKDGFSRYIKNYETKHKDKMVQKITQYDPIKQQNELKILKQKQPGIVYRDTFQKLIKLGLQNQSKIKNYNSKSHPKFSKSIINGNSSNNKEQYKKVKDDDVELEQRLLFSKTNNLNKGEIINNYLINQIQNEQQINRSRKTKSINQKSILRKQNIKIDQKALKRIMIKFGTYKKIISEKAKPFKVGNVFNDKFNDIVSSSIMRRANLDVSKIQSSKIKQYIIYKYRDTVTNFQTQQTKNTNQNNFYRSYTLQNMKKNIVKLNQESQKKRRIQSAKTSLSHKDQVMKHDRIYVSNQKQKRQTRNSTFTGDNDIKRDLFSSGKQTNEQKKNKKIILLNHMMKPMIYNF